MSNGEPTKEATAAADRARRELRSRRSLEALLLGAILLCGGLFAFAVEIQSGWEAGTYTLVLVVALIAATGLVILGLGAALDQGTPSDHDYLAGEQEESRLRRAAVVGILFVAFGVLLLVVMIVAGSIAATSRLTPTPTVTPTPPSP